MSRRSTASSTGNPGRRWITAFSAYQIQRNELTIFVSGGTSIIALDSICLCCKAATLAGCEPPPQCISIMMWLQTHRKPRSDVRRVGKECVRTWRYRGWPEHEKQKKI